MQTRIIFAVFAGAALSSIVIIGAFTLITFHLGNIYIGAVGSLIHPNQDISRAILHILNQSCAMGAAGGYLFVLQIIFNVAHSNENWFASESISAEHFLIGGLIPLKGLIAGGMTGAIVGGIFFMIGNVEGLAKGHLFVLGISCIAGYSEQVLQKIVQFGTRHAEKL